MANSSKLSSVYEEVEIRKFEGLSSLNPRVILCMSKDWSNLALHYTATRLK